LLKGETLELRYFVTSGSSIVENGEETINVGDEDLTSEFVGAAEVIKFEGNISEAKASDKHVLSKKIIKINRPLVDEARLSSKINLLVINCSFFLPIILN
jgi:hypothetical protein